LESYRNCYEGLGRLRKLRKPEAFLRIFMKCRKLYEGLGELRKYSEATENCRNAYESNEIHRIA
jgi:hypothetical protein